jgi:hypothetical protein
MGNKNTTSLPVMTDVQVHPRCVHRGCRFNSYAGFVMCLNHIIEAKRKQIEEDEQRERDKDKDNRKDGPLQ